MTKQIAFYLSDGLKDALDKYTGDHKKNLSEVIREAIAERIDYDLSQDKKRHRPSKYKSEEHKRQVYNAKARKRRKLIAQLVNAQDQAEIEQARKALQESLE